ncbi:MAG TPA: DNA repair protein RecO, partial [Thermoanaerobaculia bacterium]|nr:DNA repair protein RecO [Thermoanaerobaculia bacterium]
EKGLVRAAVRGARGKSKKGASLQLLTEVTVSLFRKEGADLSRADAMEIERSSFALAQSPDAAMLLPYLAESVLTFVPENEPGGEVYRLLRHTLDALESGAPASLSARYFEVWLLRFAGLFPDERACAACGELLEEGAAVFAPEVPGFFHAACAARGSLSVSLDVRSLVSRFRRSTLSKLVSSQKLSDETLDGVESLTREVRRRFLGHELKSYRFLRSLL